MPGDYRTPRRKLSQFLNWSRNFVIGGTVANIQALRSRCEAQGVDHAVLSYLQTAEAALTLAHEAMGEWYSERVREE